MIYCDRGQFHLINVWQAVQQPYELDEVGYEPAVADAVDKVRSQDDPACCPDPVLSRQSSLAGGRQWYRRKIFWFGVAVRSGAVDGSCADIKYPPDTGSGGFAQQRGCAPVIDRAALLRVDSDI